MQRRDRKIHAAVDKALRDAGLDYCNTDLQLDAPAYHDVLEEIPGATVQFRLRIWGIEDGDEPKVVCAMRTLGLRNPLDGEAVHEMEYCVDLT